MLKADDMRNKEVEVRLVIPGNDLFSRACESQFEAAADRAIEAISRQLEKFKERDLFKPRVNPLKPI